ncbi:transposase DDE domain protein [Clostridium magnum DSM 2767]|uniref:Transposase DDE domain protein n=1 Tax=Clostridium magnum DSM 2767 TaxID=1121326 RepID=A0A161X4Y1_9CLOT|nr:transposase DDE domain protein [Clostridium magnum DSM 2767]SHI23417.1 Transposase [Clostridium magnum DSM 2767]
MQITNLTQKDYTTRGSLYQLKLPLNIEYIIPKDDAVRLLSQVVEEMDLTELYQTYFRVRKNQATPRQMLKIILYAYMNHYFSSRKIETACKRDVNFMYILEGAPAPDYSTIARFRSLHFAPVSEKIMVQMTEFLAQNGELSLENLFIDGTKIEAAANKYSFVWKKSVTKNQQKLLDKIPTFILKAENDFGIKILCKNIVKIHYLKRLRKKLKKIEKDENITFVHGAGKRKSLLQKTLEQLDEYLWKLKKYNYYIHIAGDRTSFSKTDHDATFIRMKEDAMKNGQLKPAYNTQFGTDAEYIVWISAGPQCTDTTILIPFLEGLRRNQRRIYKNIIADSGYKSEENYVYLEESNQLAFIKPSNYEISKTRKYKTDISRKENMTYNSNEDVYICINGKKLKVCGTKNSKNKTGYVSKKTCNTSKACGGCQLKSKCIKGINSNPPLEERTKHLEISKLFQEKREKSLKRILSYEEIALRMNRSIHSEGAFAEVKQDMGFHIM